MFLKKPRDYKIISKLGSYLKKEDSKEIFKNTLWLFADKIVRQGFNFALSIYIARYLGVELFGLWSYAVAFVLLFSFFSTLGIYNQLCRDFVKCPEKRDELLGNAFLIKLLGGFVTVTASFGAILFLKPGQPLLQTIVFVISTGYVFQAFDVIDFFFQSQLKAVWIAKARFFSFFFFAIVKFGLIYYHFTIVYFVLCQTCELAFSAIFLVLFFNKNFGSVLKWRINRRYAKAMVIESLPILLSEVAIIIYMRVDQIMIGELVGNKSLGVFSAGVKLSEIWNFIPTIICSSTFPAIIIAHNTSLDSYHQKLQRLYDILIWISIFLALTISLFSGYIIDFLFGEKFYGAASILSIHIWSSPFLFLAYPSNQQLVIEKLSKISFYRTVVGLFLNVSLNFMLIPKYGGIGAATATLIAQLVSNWLACYFFKESRVIFWMFLRAMDPRRLLKFN